MADNIPISLGGGAASIAAQDVSGVFYQKVELYGAGGSSVASIDPAGAVKVSVAGIVNVAGSVAAIVTGTPNVNVAGSVVAFQGGAPWANTNVGSVITVSQSSSTIAVVTGSVVAVQGTSPWAVTNVGSIVSLNVGSVITTNVGSVIAVIQGSSILAVPVGSTIAVLQSSSILAVPVSSVIAVIQGSIATGVFSSPSVVQGTADLRVVQGGSVAALAGPGAGIRIYVNAVQVSNFGPSSVLVKISDNTTSVLGWTIAPAGGGSNFNPTYRAALASPVTASISGTASVLVSMQGYTSST